MGIAVRADSIAIGTGREIWDFRNDRKLAKRGWRIRVAKMA